MRRRLALLTLLVAAASPAVTPQRAHATVQVEAVATDGTGRQLLHREPGREPLTGLVWSGHGVTALRTGTLVRGLGLTPAIRALDPRTFSAPTPDGTRLAELSNDRRRTRVRVRDAASGAVLLTTRLDVAPGNAELCWSPSGARLAVQVSDPAYDMGRLYVLDAATGRVLLRTHTYSESITRTACFSPDEREVVSSPPAINVDASARVLDIATAEERFVPQRGRSFTDVAAFAPDGRLLLLAEREVTLADAITGRGTSMRWPKGPRLSERTYDGLAWSPDGAGLALLVTTLDRDGFDHELAVLRLTGGAGADVSIAQPKTLVRPSARTRIVDLAWSPDGARIAFSLVRADRG